MGHFESKNENVFFVFEMAMKVYYTRVKQVVHSLTWQYKKIKGTEVQ